MSYWENKQILITGYNGFVGSHLKKRLEGLGAKVYGVSRSAKGSRSFKASVTNFSALDSIISRYEINICFHLAAESLVEQGQSNPYYTFKNNIDGTINVLESARKNGLERIIIASTSHVYGDNKTPYLEKYYPRPSRPYETSKTCMDLIAQSYANTFSLPVLIPRFVNIYGPGDLNFNRLIPKTVKSVIRNESPKMWGGGARRDYLFIEDVINAYILLGQTNISKIGKNRVFNFGSNNILSVNQIIDKIVLLSGKKLKITKIEDAREFEIKEQYSSWNKAKKTFGWEPRYSIDDGLIQTINWYKKYFDEKI